MSQKSEKFARNLLRRQDKLEAEVNAIKKHQSDSDTFDACLESVRHKIAVEDACKRKDLRKRAHAAEVSAAKWKKAYAGTLIASCVIIATLVALCVCTNAEAPTTYNYEPAKSQVAAPIAPTVSSAAYVSATQTESTENAQIEKALLAKATKIDDVTVTHYCICRKCCGKSSDHPAYGITASGVKAAPGISVAVDPDVIPLGSDVLVDYGDGEIHYYHVDDTGAGVNGKHIDLCVNSHEKALQLGLRNATVYWIPAEN